MENRIPVVSVKNARKSFDGVEVLRDISYDVYKGDAVCVIGPSGGGKSTLLRCMTLLETLDGGSLSYGELPVVVDGLYGSKEVLAKARQHFGLVFQQFNLFPHFTVMKNICDAPVVVQGRDKAEVEEEARALIKKMGLEGHEDKVPCQLSGGQQQRVSIARALAMHPDVIFFDEPTSALDPELTGEVLKVIREMVLEDMTLVIVTHEMGFARDVAERVVFMDGGVIVEEGTADEVMRHPQNERTKSFLARDLG